MPVVLYEIGKYAILQIMNYGYVLLSLDDWKSKIHTGCRRVNPYTSILHFIWGHIIIVWTCDAAMKRQFCQLSESV